MHRKKYALKRPADLCQLRCVRNALHVHSAKQQQRYTSKVPETNRNTRCLRTSVSHGLCSVALKAARIPSLEFSSWAVSLDPTRHYSRS